MEPCAVGWVGDSPLNAVCHAACAFVVGDVATFQVVHDVGLSALAEGHRQAAARLPLNQRARQILVERGGEHDVAVAVKFVKLAGAHRTHIGVRHGYFFEKRRVFNVTVEQEVDFLRQLWAVCGDVLRGFEHFGKSLVVLVESARTHDNHRLVERHAGVSLRQSAVLVVVGRESVENHSHIAVLHNRALSAHPFQPMAHRHEMNGHTLVERGFAPLGGGGEVGAALASQVAGLAGAFVALARESVVAHTGAVPHVVHHPNDGFAQSVYLLNAFERERALVHPCQHHHIGIFHPRVGGGVGTILAGVDFEKRATVGSVVHHDA